VSGSAADTSVVVAALLAGHSGHAAADAALPLTTATIPQVALEAYAVLTRLPIPNRIDGPTALSLLHERLPRRWSNAGGELGIEALDDLARAGVTGGAAYDGLIALCARAAGLELISRDKRAARTYRSLGVSFELLGP
jgi:toxin FitB